MAEPTDTDALRRLARHVPEHYTQAMLRAAADEIDRRREQERRLRDMAEQRDFVRDRDLLRALDDQAGPDGWQWLGFDR